MRELGVAILAHNEAANIASALESVSWAEQVVVVDASSEDGTGDIARAHGAEVFSEPNLSNLNINKNIAIDHCRTGWVLVLDADEIIPDALAGEIRKVIADGRIDGFLIPRRNHVLGKWARRGSQYPDYQLRLFRKDRGRFRAGHVHERLQVDGSVGCLTEPIEHHPYPNIATMMRKNEFYARFEALRLFEQGAKINTFGLFWRGFLRPFGRAMRRLFLKGGILDGVPGVILVAFDFWNNALSHLLLWELNNRRQNETITSTIDQRPSR